VATVHRLEATVHRRGTTVCLQQRQFFSSDDGLLSREISSSSREAERRLQTIEILQ
jgi:hypothetical protein